MQQVLTSPSQIIFQTGILSDIDYNLVEIRDDNVFTIGNYYYQNNIAGSLPRVFLRGELVKRLRAAHSRLPEGYKFYIFDGFRTFRTQSALFELFVDRIMCEGALGRDEAIARAKEFCTIPAPENLDAIPHLTGGAVDLTLEYNNHLVDMGTAFDEPSELSHTAYFEQDHLTCNSTRYSAGRWNLVRENRQRLLHVLTEVGFTNYHNEWWHFDFGNSFWACKNRCNQIFFCAEGSIEHSK